MIEQDDPRLVFIPEEKATEPKDGFCICYKDKWWAYTDKGLLFYRARKRDPLSPQCNSHYGCTKDLCEHLYPWAQIKCVEFVIMRANPEDYI